MPKLALYMKCLAKILEYAARHTIANQLFNCSCHPQTSSLHVLLQVATCYHMLGQLQDAVEVYETSASY